MAETSRAEHLNWCKQRAFAYCDQGDWQQAFASFGSDVGKHPETESIRELIQSLGMPLVLMGEINDPESMRRHIDGYN